MGITGLLPLLKDIVHRIHISEYTGKKVAIDGHSWIHMGLYGCSLDLYMGKETRKYIDYCMKRIDQLLENGVVPVVVFDGKNLPMKASREKERYKRREEARKVVDRALNVHDLKTAWEYAHRCVDVTSTMVDSLILVLKAAGISCMVAPYEADAQMAYLSLSGQVDAIVSEDSDMLLYGCPRVLFKLKGDGYADEVRVENVERTGMFRGFSLERFRHACILSGCDYLPSIPRMGLKTAASLLANHGSIEAVFRAKIFEEDYIAEFRKADFTFQHQVVFSTTEKTLSYLKPVPKEIPWSDLAFLGSIIDTQVSIPVYHNAMISSSPVKKRSRLVVGIRVSPHFLAH